MSYRAIPETYAAIVEHIIDVLARIACDYLIGERYTELTNCTACKLGVAERITHYDIYSICYGGHFALIRRHAKNYNVGLRGACRGGQYRMACWLLEQGATDVGDSLYHACCADQLELAKLMIRAGATDFNCALDMACRVGDEEFAKQMIRAGARDFNRALVTACRLGHIPLAKLMISADARNLNYRELLDVCSTDDVEIVKMLIEIGVDNIYDVIRVAVRNGYINLSELLHDAGDNISDAL